MNKRIHKLIIFTGLISFSVFCISKSSIAQEMPSIATDRPDQTECPYIVPAGHFQLEAGFNYESVDQKEKKWILPTTLWKYGINDHFELRLITEVNKNQTDGKSTSGFLPAEIGFKVKLMEEKGILPLTSFISHLSVPNLSSKQFSTTYFAPNFRFTMLHSLSDRLTLSYNLGAEWDGENPEAIFIYTLAPAYSFTNKIGGYIELYGFAPQNQRADHRADGGITYLLKHNIQLDFSGGFRITNNAPEYYGALGFSIRLPK
jgi:hypothetical protein